jgi:hypothetical protein
MALDSLPRLVCAVAGLLVGLFGCGDDNGDAGSIAVHLNHEVDGVVLELSTGTEVTGRSMWS